MTRCRAGAPGAAWGGLAAVLALGALAAPHLASPAGLAWQPEGWALAPWRWWTAGFVHLSPGHLGANLAATAVVAAFGLTAALPARTAAAWFAAWPLTHLALLATPALRHYGGLSGVLHAGVAAAALHLALAGTGRARTVGLAALLGLAAKLAWEGAWRQPVQASTAWDFPVAVVAHLTGALAGAGCALVAEAASLSRRRSGARHA